MTPRIQLLTAAAAALVAVVAEPAQARIQCDGPYQIVQGRPISTPYCQDTYLAHVANLYGIRVSANEIRWSPDTKQRVCLAIGHDIRVQDACVGLRQRDRGGSFFP